MKFCAEIAPLGSRLPPCWLLVFFFLSLRDSARPSVRVITYRHPHTHTQYLLLLLVYSTLFLSTRTQPPLSSSLLLLRGNGGGRLKKGSSSPPPPIPILSALPSIKMPSHLYFSSGSWYIILYKVQPGNRRRKRRQKSTSFLTRFATPQ